MFVTRYTFYDEANDLDGLPIKIWLKDEDHIEPDCLKQAYNLAMLPFAFHHIALMPDTHKGYGMPIGGVLATEGVVVPNAVGVDIGCGMCALNTGIKDYNPDFLKRVMGEIRETIPVGMTGHEKPCLNSEMPMMTAGRVCHEEFEKAKLQMGTLGGGNHFIELQTDEENNLWVMIHSGSRHLGKTVADFYNDKAVELNKKWHSKVPKEHKLAFLPLDTEEGQDYLREMNYCVEYALLNRKAMMDNVIVALRNDRLNGLHLEGEMNDLIINVTHNYAAMENHFGRNVMVHRKGATRARDEELGIIPGAQGVASYIVIGKGCKDSFESCSHGAGRKMGRKEAQRTLDLEGQKKFLDDQGIIHGVRGKDDLDEAPGAYKDIDEVMANQSDLVDIVTKLRTLAVIKG